MIASCVMVITLPLRAGNDHIEMGEAGSIPGGAQPVYKPPGNLNLRIMRGQFQVLPGPLRGADLQDMYLINIPNPALFSATTNAADFAVSDLDSVKYCGCSGALLPIDYPADCESEPLECSLNTQLWLFKASLGDGFGVIANDDITPLNFASRIPAGSIAGQPPGCYFLAISVFNSDPVSVGGPIFNQATTTEVTGPDGAGTGFAHTGWTGTVSKPTGDYEYTIILQGAEGFEEEEPIDCSMESIPAVSSLGVAVLITGIVACGGFILLRRKPAAALVDATKTD